MSLRRTVRKVRRVLYVALIVVGIAVTIPAIDGTAAAARSWSPADALDAFARWAVARDGETPAPAPEPAPPAPPVPTTAGGLLGPQVTITRLIDADTYELSDGRQLRLANADAPENQTRDRGTFWCKNKPASAAATLAVAGWLDATSWTVYLSMFGEDGSGHRDMTALVQLADGTDLGQRLVHDGLAVAWAPRPTTPEAACPPNVAGGQHPNK